MLFVRAVELVDLRREVLPAAAVNLAGQLSLSTVRKTINTFIFNVLHILSIIFQKVGNSMTDITFLKHIVNQNSMSYHMV